MFALRPIGRIFLCAMALSLFATAVATYEWAGVDTLLSISASGGEGTSSDIDWP